MPLGDNGHERGRVGRLAVPDSEREPIGTIGADGLGGPAAKIRPQLISHLGRTVFRSSSGSSASPAGSGAGPTPTIHASTTSTSSRVPGGVELDQPCRADVP